MSGFRPAALLQKPGDPVPQGGDFVFVQQRGKSLRHGATPVVQSGSQSIHVGQQASGDFLPGEIPNHRPQTMVCVEGDAVVDSPESTPGIQQTVAALAISVVDNVVEE